MLDAKLRPLIDIPLNKAGKFLARKNIHPNSITLAGFIFALLCFAALAFQQYSLALIFIFLNRLADGLDGAAARQMIIVNHSDVKSGSSDFGGFLDIVTDFIFYSGTVFFFAAGQPEFMFHAAFLLFSFFGAATTFLAFAIMAAKNNLETEHQGQKSFYYMAGIAEGTETFLFLVLFCLFPAYFPVISLIFAALCWLTAFGRIGLAYKCL